MKALAPFAVWITIAFAVLGAAVSYGMLYARVDAVAADVSLIKTAIITNGLARTTP